MKIVFKLGSYEKLIAEGITQRTAARDAETLARTDIAEETDKYISSNYYIDGMGYRVQDTWYKCGNLLGLMYDHGYNFNDNQHLSYDAEKGVVTYSGERHPLRQDGGMEILEEIFGDAESAEVVNYETSDTRMEWWEVERDLLRRMGVEECLAEMCKDLERHLRKGNYGDDFIKTLANTNEKILGFRGELEKILRSNIDQLHATYTLAELNQYVLPIYEYFNE